jgi:hypothetical protein
MAAAAMAATGMSAGPLSGCKRSRRKSGGRYHCNRHGLNLAIHDTSLKALRRFAGNAHDGAVFPAGPRFV